MQAHRQRLSSHGFTILEGVSLRGGVGGGSGSLDLGRVSAALSRGRTAAAEEEAKPEERQHAITHCPELAPLLAHPRVLEITQAVLDSHVRILQLSLEPQLHLRTPPELAGGGFLARNWFCDPPHDLLDEEGGGAVQQPFPDICMALTAVFYMPSSAPTGLFVVPGSHRVSANPLGPHDGLDPFAEFLPPVAPTISMASDGGSGGEVWIPLPLTPSTSGDECTVLLCDSRLWRSMAPAAASAPAATALYGPWWMSCEMGASNLRTVSASTYATLGDLCPSSQLLFRHRAEGVGDLIQQPRLLDGWRMPQLPAARGDNSWVAVAGVEKDFVDKYYQANGFVPVSSPRL